MATEVVDQSSVELVRLVAQGRSMVCEAILDISGESVVIGFRYIPTGLSQAVVYAEVHARLRAIREAVMFPCVESEREAERRLDRMTVDLEALLTDMPL